MQFGAVRVVAAMIRKMRCVRRLRSWWFPPTRAWASSEIQRLPTGAWGQQFTRLVTDVLQSDAARPQDEPSWGERVVAELRAMKLYAYVGGHV